MLFGLKYRETCTFARLPVWLLRLTVQQLSRCMFSFLPVRSGSSNDLKASQERRGGSSRPLMENPCWASSVTQQLAAVMQSTGSFILLHVITARSCVLRMKRFDLAPWLFSSIQALTCSCKISPAVDYQVFHLNINEITNLDNHV